MVKLFYNIPLWQVSCLSVAPPLPPNIFDHLATYFSEWNLLRENVNMFIWQVLNFRSILHWNTFKVSPNRTINILKLHNSYILHVGKSISNWVSVHVLTLVMHTGTNGHRIVMWHSCSLSPLHTPARQWPARLLNIYNPNNLPEWEVCIKHGFFYLQARSIS